MLDKRQIVEMIVDRLSVLEGVMLFCLASETDWRRVGVKAATAQQMLIRGLIKRDADGSFRLTDKGRSVLEALMMGLSATEQYFGALQQDRLARHVMLPAGVTLH